VDAVAGIRLNALDDAEIAALSGGAAFLSGLSIGAAFSTNEIANVVRAYVDSAQAQSSGGAIALTATSSASVRALAIGAAEADTVAAGGSVSLNEITSRIEAYADHGAALSAAGAVTLTAADASVIEALAGGAAASLATLGIGAAVSTNDIRTRVRSHISGSNVTAETIEILATGGSTVRSLTAGAAGAEDVAFAGSYSKNVLAGEIVAFAAESSQLISTGEIVIAAQDTSTVAALAGSGAGSGQVSVSGSVAINEMTTLVRAAVDDAIVQAAALTVRAEAAASIDVISGAGTGAGSFAGAGAVVLNAIDGTVEAHVSGADALVTTPALTVLARDASSIDAVAGVGVGSGSGALAGTLADNRLTGTLLAAIDSGATVTGSGTVTVSAINDANILLRGGGGVGAGTAAGGAAIGTNTIAVTTRATIADGNVSAPAISVQAQNDADIEALTAIGAGAGTASGDAAVALNDIDNHTEASIAGGIVTASGALRVEATENSSIRAATGAAAGAGQLAIAVGVSTNDIGSTVTAFIAGGAEVDAASIVVSAAGTASLETAAVGGSGAGGLALTAGGSLNDIHMTVDAHVGAEAVVTASTDLAILAQDSATIRTLTGQGAGAFVGIGAAASYSEIANMVWAYVEDASVSVTSGSARIEAQSAASITSLTAGAAGGAGGVAGSVSIALIETEVEAYVADATVTAGHNLLVQAQWDDSVTANAGAIAGGFVGAAGSVAFNTLAATTRAYIDDATVAARGNGGTMTVKRWNADTGVESGEAIRGLAVIATSTERLTVRTATIAGGVGALAGTVSINTVADLTEAYIAHSAINTAADFGEAVLVRAHQDTDIDVFSGSLAGGLVGIGGVVDRTTIENRTRAFIAERDESGADADTGASVVHGTRVEVSTLTRERVDPIAAGVAGGLAGVAGAVSMISIDSDNDAYVRQSDVFSLGSITILADDDARIVAVVGNIAGGFVGAAGSISINSVTNTTRAQALGANLNAVGALRIEADSDELIDTLVGTAAGGAGAIAGGVTVNSIEATTEANVLTSVRASLINQDARFRTGGSFAPGAGQTVTVLADDTATIDGDSGTIAGGVVGVGATIEVSGIRNRTVALIGTQTRIGAAGDISVLSNADREMNSLTIAGAGGLLGLSGAISVLSLGTAIDAEGAAEFNGALRSQVAGDLATSDAGTFLNGSEATAVRARGQIASRGNVSINAALDPSINFSSKTTSALIADAGSAATAAELVAGGNITIDTAHRYRVDISTGQIAVGLVGLGAGVGIANIHSDARARAGSFTVLEAGGEVTVRARDFDTSPSSVSAFGGQFAVGAAGGAFADLDLDVNVDARLADNVFVRDASAVNIEARQRGHLSADAFGLQVGGIAIGASMSDVEVSGNVNAVIGNGVRIGSASDRVGALNMRATGFDDARANTDAGGGGILAGQLNVADVSVTPSLRSTIGSNTDIRVDGDVSLETDLAVEMDADTRGVNVGAATMGRSDANVRLAPDLLSRIGTGANIVAGGEVLLRASHEPEGGIQAHAETSAGALIASNGATSTAEASADVESSVGSGASIDAASGLFISAASLNIASATGDGFVLGAIVGLGGVDTEATASGRTEARLDDGVRVRGGGLTIDASTFNNAVASSAAAGGGIISGSSVDALVTVAPVVRAFIGNGADVNVAGSVLIRTNVETDADAPVTGTSGGAIDVGDSSAEVLLTPQVDTFIGNDARIVASDEIRIEARHGDAVSVSDGSFVPSSAVFIADDVILIGNHGLLDGSAVTYYAQGNTPVGGLTDSREYKVVRVDENAVMLGSAFDAATVDGARDLIVFAGGHAFQTGDRIVYHTGGNSALPGLVDGTTYFVRRIDDATIKLSTSLAQAIALMPVFDPTLVDNAGDRIVRNGHGFADGQAVTYRAPAAKGFSAGLVDVVIGPGGTLEPDAGAETIYIENHGFSTGDRITYRTDGAAIGGLANGGEYFVIRVNANLVKLAASADDANDGDALVLDPAGVPGNVAHSIARSSERPIAGLVDGQTYYVLGVDANSFRLALTPGGSAIDIDATGVTGPHTLGTEGVDIAPASGRHIVAVDLTSAPGGTHRLSGAGGALGLIDAPSGDGIATASARGSGGGFIGIKGTDARVMSDVVVNTFVGDRAALDAGGDIIFTSFSASNGSTIAKNRQGGVLAIGVGEATADVYNTHRGTIGTNASIVTDRDFKFTLESSNLADTFADSAGGGVIEIANSDADSILRHETELTVGEGAFVSAARGVALTATSGSRVTATASSNGGGFGVDSDGDGVARILGLLDDDPTLTRVRFAAGSRVEALDIDVDTHVSVVGEARGTGEGGGFGTNNDGHATVEARSHSEILLQSGSSLFGEDSLEMRAQHPVIDTYTKSRGDSTSFFGDSDASSRNDQITSSRVVGEPSALLTTSNLVVQTFSFVHSYTNIASKDGGLIDIGNESSDGDYLPERLIDFNSDIVLLGQRPELIVDSAGNVTARNITFTNNATEVIVHDIGYLPGTAAFEANIIDDFGNTLESLIQGDQTLLDVRETLRRINITNFSAKDLVLNQIDPVNRGLRPTVTIMVEQVPFEFDVTHSFAPTLLDIRSLGLFPQADIFFDSVVENPIGDTRVLNVSGNIASRTKGLIRTNLLDLEASLGNISAVGRTIYFPVELVASPGRPIYAEAKAGGDIHMSLLGRLRDPDPIELEVQFGPVEAGGNIDLFIHESIRELARVGPNYRLLVDEPYVPLTTVVINHFRPFFFEVEGWLLDIGIFARDGSGENATYRFELLEAGGNIDVVAHTDNFRTHIEGFTDILALGNIDVTTSGHIFLDEVAGDMRIGRIISFNDDVRLLAPQSIFDTPEDPEADVEGESITLTALGGFIGSFANPLEIDSSRVLPGAVEADAVNDIVLIETLSDLNVARILSRQDDVSLTATSGGIFDFFDDVAADVIAVNLTLAALKGAIGVRTNDLDIDSSSARAGRLKANTPNSVFITETDGLLNVQQVVGSGGDIRLTVTDTAATDEDIVLMEGGFIFTNEVDITLRAGDDIDTRLESAMFAKGDIVIEGDFGDADPDVGTRIVLRGSTIADTITVRGGEDDDEVRIENNARNLLIATFGGDDFIFGSNFALEQPLPNGTFFSEVIDAGEGNDRVYGLGGADVIFGSNGDDWIDGGAGNDVIFGGEGDDELWGGFGNDELRGSSGVDYIDGGFGSDQLFGEGHDDRLFGGGGAGDLLDGGDGDDMLEGSDDGPDEIRGGAGRDYLFGRGGNDKLLGDADDDVLDGGAGDDVLEGGAGSDLLVGGANHDILLGHASTGLGNGGGIIGDRAVDYLYGDFGTNLNEPGSGRDQLNGQDGNDLLFGEGDDDLIGDTQGASNWIDFGAGDGATPNSFVPPVATPNPAPVVTVNEPRAVNTLPLGPTYAGWWTEIAGSATGYGLTGGIGAALDATVASDASGVRYVAWADTRNGNYEIYVARESAAGWIMLGGSAAGGGISATTTDSRRPALLLFNGAPVVAWTETNASGSDIRVTRYNAATDRWVALGPTFGTGTGSLVSSSNLSGTGRGDQVQLFEYEGRVLATWLDSSSGSQVYAKTFNGTDWVALTPGSATGTGITQHAAGVAEYDVAVEGSRIAVTYSSGSADTVDIFARVREGNSWVGIGGSATGSGLSASVTESREPDAAWLSGQLFVAYRERVADLEQIYVKTFAGGTWQSAGTDGAVANGVSDTSRRSLDPKLETGGGQLFLAWVDHDSANYADPDAHIYVKRWNGTAFVEALAGDARGDGISATGGKLSALALSVDAAGLPSIVWNDETSGLPQVYLRTLTALPARVFVADASTSVQAILDANDLAAGDVIVLAAGSHAGFTLTSNDAGVLVLGAQGGTSIITGAVTVEVGSVLQRLTLTGGITMSNAAGAALVDSTVGGDGLAINGGDDLHVLHNRFVGEIGIRIASTSGGLIAHNDIAAKTVGLAIDALFDGEIRDNDIRGSALGVRYAAAANLSANRIHDNVTGVRSTVSGTGDALGFVGTGAPNRIFDNQLGLELVNAAAQNQVIENNLRGVAGSGRLGGVDIALANQIEDNDVGVDRFAGTIAFNRIAGNAIGIQAASDSLIQHNFIYRNGTTAIALAGVSDVRIEDNTLYTPAGDLIRLTDGTSDVTVLRNVLWTENGYDLFVADDSQSGFFSDFNNLYATGSGKIGFWTRDFIDILDWQADIARFDLNSFGATVVNPQWARPRFADLHADDYRLLPMFGTQRFSSPGALPAAGIPHIALRSPDLYVDAVRDVPLVIRWQSFNNAGGSQVRIDLYVDTADGPALLTNIVGATPDDGEFAWTPATSGIAFGTFGLRIQVSWTSNPLVLDRSQEPFTVPQGGNDYWVDDASNTNDEYTPAATGSNRNTGKSPDAPKPNPANLLRAYTLGPGARLFIDTGSYEMLAPLAISGSTDLGLGLDHGFFITGPTTPARVAELLPAVTGDRSWALITLQDADDMRIERLTLRDALHGLHVTAGSSGLIARNLIITGDAGDGLRVEGGSAVTEFFNIRAQGNDGFGIYVHGTLTFMGRAGAIANEAGGIFLRGAIDQVVGNTASDNDGYGFEIQATGAALIHGNSSSDNERGMRIANTAGGAAAQVGSETLAAGTGNVVYDNVLSGIEASGNVLVAGNTVARQTDAAATGITLTGGANAKRNIVYGNFVGIEAQGATVSGNRVYGNRGFGIRADESDLAENVVYSNPVGIVFSGNGKSARNNLIYANSEAGVIVEDGSDLLLQNNTVYATSGDAVRVTSSGTELRNNILWAENGFAIDVAAGAIAGFASDYNLFFHSPAGTGDVGRWAGNAAATLADWRSTSGADEHSLFADPLFVDPDGADSVLGFVADVSNGSDDDFHEQSIGGSFHGGSFAPVEGFSAGRIVPGRPAPVSAVLTTDASHSPAIDRGDEDDAFNREPMPNGGYINIGAYGNTEQASLSRPAFVLLITPNGGESIHQRASYDILWHHAGFTGTVDIAYSNTGVAGTFFALATGEVNDGLYRWTVDPVLFPAGTQYVVRVSSSASPALADASDAVFAVINDAPVVGDLADVTLNEGDPYSVRVSAIDPEGGTLTATVTGIAGISVVRDGDDFVIAWARTPDGDAASTVMFTVTDDSNPARSVSRSFDVEILNVAPELSLSGAASNVRGEVYTLGLEDLDPGDDTIIEWEIDWGDGSVQKIAGDPSTATHIYTAAPGNYIIRASATDEDGTFDADPFTLRVDAAPALHVTSFAQSTDGFSVRFNRAIDTGVLNLYDGGGAGYGVADVVLTGPAGQVAGSLLLDDDAAGFRMFKTGIPLAAGSYTARLLSGSIHLRDAEGRLLDGDADGVDGGDFVRTFDVAANSAPRIYVIDFMRGPGQDVDLPATGAGMPVRIAGAVNLTVVEFELHFDPALFVIDGVLAAAGWSGATLTPVAAGVVRVEASASSAITGADIEVVRLLARVPDTAVYGAKHVLELRNVRLNDSSAPVLADSGLHVAGFIGDASFSADYSLQDVQQLQSVLVRRDTGFGTWPLIDPLVIGDTSGNGLFNTSDATLLLRETSGNDQPQIPPLPATQPDVPLGGPDPFISMEKQSGVSGRTVTVPITLDTAAGLNSVQLRVVYDPAVFELLDVRKGSLTGAFDWLVDRATPGVIEIDLSRRQPLESGAGTVAELDLRIRDGVASGSYRLDLQWARLNDGRLTLTPVPQVGDDATDGVVDVTAPTSTSLLHKIARSLADKLDMSVVASKTTGVSAYPLEAAIAPSLPDISSRSSQPEVVIDLSASAPAAVVPAPSSQAAAIVTSPAWTKDFLKSGTQTAANANSKIKLTVPVREPLTPAVRA